MAHDVFICHAHEDYTTALAACAKLEEAHVRCWIAPRDVGPGAYAKQLVQAIDGASAVLLVFSEKANRSEHVLRELEIASNRQKVIIPFKIENVRPNEDLEYFTLRVHWLDALNPPLEHRLDELVHFVQRLLAAQPVLTPPAGDVATPIVEEDVAEAVPPPAPPPLPEPATRPTLRTSVTPTPVAAGFPRALATLVIAIVLAVGAGGYALLRLAHPTAAPTPRPSVAPAPQPTPFIPARAGHAIPAGFVVMYDRLGGVLWGVSACAPAANGSRITFQIFNDYHAMLNTDVALTRNSSHPDSNEWFPKREQLATGLSAPLSDTVAGFTCGKGDLYAALRRVRFGPDRGPYVAF